jgi:hypothetical protein
LHRHVVLAASSLFIVGFEHGGLSSSEARAAAAAADAALRSLFSGSAVYLFKLSLLFSKSLLPASMRRRLTTDGFCPAESNFPTIMSQFLMRPMPFKSFEVLGQGPNILKPKPNKNRLQPKQNKQKLPWKTDCFAEARTLVQPATSRAAGVGCFAVALNSSNEKINRVT